MRLLNFVLSCPIGYFPKQQKLELYLLKAHQIHSANYNHLSYNQELRYPFFDLGIQETIHEKLHEKSRISYLTHNVPKMAKLPEDWETGIGLNNPE